MDLQKIMAKARDIASSTGTITTEQLNGMCPNNMEPEDIAALFAALRTEGIRLKDDEAEK
ncbi:hypothetical protein AOQ73_00890 [Bradyrhizobium pachyrhizi]|uniref:hypothetical protein n=1 Tax=Bradyrhizobium TaxID=374 RepID=UPI0007049813|nr:MULTISPECIES: hypothetical protein [Bradyrhizobium]MCP1914060.1 hypothetical protein [Bradyrhizobium elkanii]KRQ14068.1 hypothetical protein AOQ73_00890 [Bradyrhizobium pachyrhizi]MCP1831212.1 hypothetical protein [Bradyrhizobium sp. USDA 4545]MCP1849905.1 hypothetical protein [Bradyrhizobium sp. USDA 4541]MCP1924321.1 hypothetical protein [Bradyrhizobium sp. USDA 4532]